MKKFILFACCFAFVSAVSAEDVKPASPDAQVDVSYSLGMLVGTSIKNTGLNVDAASFVNGLKDSLDGKPTKYTPEQAQSAIQAAAQVAAAKKGADNLAAGQAFLDSNKKKAGIKVTASGLQYEVLTMGKGPLPKATDTVKVHYEGKLLSGAVFDSSIARNEPATFQLDGVISGWTEGVQLMPVGSKFRFFVPSSLAYGEQGAGSTIEPNATLIFEVELLSIETGN